MTHYDIRLPWRLRQQRIHLLMQETRVQFLGRDDTLEKEMATYSSNPSLGNPTDRGGWWAIVH